MKQFISLPTELIDKKSFRNKFLKTDKLHVYLWLKRHVIRGGHPDYVDIYRNYWRKGKLATAIPIKKIAKDIDFTLASVKDLLKQLRKEGIIEMEPRHSPDANSYAVFVLGHLVNGEEHYFIEDVF